MATFDVIGGLSETELFDEFENAQDISVSIIVEADEPEDPSSPEPLPDPVIVGYSVSPNTLPDKVLIEFSDNVLSLTAEDLLGVFPILTIKYVTPSQKFEEVFDFDDVPNDKSQIYEFRKDPSSVIVYTLTVDIIDENEMPDSKDFTFTVRSNYSTTRDRLKLEIQKRS